MWAEGVKLLAETILEFIGNIKLEWKYINGSQECHLETSDIFKSF